MLADKKILVAVCGSIAAYKVAFFVRLLKKEGAEVKVIMTSTAKEFITPLTLATLSQNPVHSDYFDKKSGEWNSHVALGLWADFMIITPLSANTLGKMANGICNNFLLATYLSARCTVIVAPAMDVDMYQHPSVVANLEKLRSFGNIIIEARHGELASGLIGKGRMVEPEDLLEIIKSELGRNKKLTGKKVMITSGPTYEAIDPVRFIGNYSSGKMGSAIALEFQRVGAEVTMISGPTQFLPKGISTIHVTSADEMLAQAEKIYTKSDIAVFASAVSDYRPERPQMDKIKKKEDSLQINLVKNSDIAATLGTKKTHQYNIGFALETSKEETNAREKLRKKNFDLIVLNSLNDNGAGFKTDTNKVTFFDKNNKQIKFELKSKSEVATDIVDYVVKNS